MKFRNNKILVFVLAAFIAVGCSKVDFGDINESPNNPSVPSISGLFANSLKSVAGVVTATTPNFYVQYLANGQYPDQSRYVTQEWSYYGFYSGALKDLQTVLQLAGESSAPNATNTTAAAKIATAYYYHVMTDRWGYIPYSEALQGLENKTPKFDSQEDVYKALFSEVDAALGMINESSGPQGDILFGGDMTRWKQFGNTLKMVMALRLSGRNDDLGGMPAAKFKEAMAGAITESSDNLLYTFLSDDNNDNPWQDRFETRVDYLLTDVLVDYLKGGNDPRLAKYANPAISSGEYNGAIYGAGNDLVENFSYPTGNIIYEGTAPGVIFTAAQVHLSIAEAIERGWVDGNAADYFKSGIMQSMSQWGVADADAQAFADAQTYNGIESIADQKWVALYLQGYESWAEWRRIGGPETIVKPEQQLNGTDIPRRQAYASTTPSINADNYNAAVAAQGPDDLDTRLWWDVN